MRTTAAELGSASPVVSSIDIDSRHTPLFGLTLLVPKASVGSEVVVDAEKRE